MYEFKKMYSEIPLGSYSIVQMNVYLFVYIFYIILEYDFNVYHYK